MYHKLKAKHCLSFLKQKCHYVPVLILKNFLAVLKYPRKEIMSKSSFIFVFYVIKEADSNYKTLVIFNRNKKVGKVRYVCHPTLLFSWLFTGDFSF